MPDFLTVKQAAQFLGVDENTIYFWIHKRKNGENIGPPFYEFGTRAKRFEKKELEKYVKDSRIEPKNKK